MPMITGVLERRLMRQCQYSAKGHSPRTHGWSDFFGFDGFATLADFFFADLRAAAAFTLRITVRATSLRFFLTAANAL